MRKKLLGGLLLGSLILVAGLTPGAGVGPPPAAEVARFRTQEIEKGLDVGYAVTLTDVNGDGKTDIVVVDTKRVIWYENPTWKLHTILEGGTKPDNVCIAPYDIDGDGQVDFALGADWHPANTKSGGTLQWLKRGKTLDEPWSLHPIDMEPTVHRIRWADVDGDGKAELVSAPLQGRNSSAKGNWVDGAPVRIVAYRIPQDPTRDRWQPQVLDESLHVVHNLWPIAAPGGKRQDILTGSYEGVHLLSLVDGKNVRQQLGSGNQETSKAKRGASEIKQGRLKNGKKFLATIEPWHGDQVVVYTEPAAGGLWDRHVIDAQLRWGHAVWCADLDGDGSEELIIGVRGLGPKNEPQDKRGVRIYKAQDERGAKWARQVVDDGGVSCEDMQAADLNGDGRVDLVAVGRFTHNVRIYWNEGK
jgi:hypothetical protein